MLTGSDSKRLNIEEYHEDHQTQQRKLSSEIGQQKLFQHIFQLFLQFYQNRGTNQIIQN